MPCVSDHRYSLAFEAAPQAMFIARRDGTLLAMNRAMRELLGRDAADASGAVHLLSLLAEPERLRPALDQLDGHGRFDSLALTFTDTRGGSHALLISATTLDDNDRPFVATVIGPPAPAAAGSDTDLATTALARMASIAAHDLNNVLGSMTGYCHVMREALTGKDDILDDLARVEEATTRAGTLARQLSAIGHRQGAMPMPLDPAGYLEARRTSIAQTLPRGVDLQLTIAGQCGEISIDAKVFDDIVVSLVANAQAAMPDGGTLHVRLGPASTGRHVVLDVTDTGAARRPFTIGTSFNPFASADACGPYSALALGAIHALVTRAGGVITAESARGFGTTFRVVFPLIDMPAPVRPARPRSASPESSGRRIFVVDDDPALLMLTGRVLSMQGYEVVEGRSGEEALSIIDTLDCPIELLLTDVMMPGVKGWEVGRAVLKRYPRCQVIYMSGYADERVRREIGNDSLFLPKPFTPPKLTEIVTSALRELDDRV